MSARVALLLRKQGVARIRPLAGGFQAWRDRGFPVVVVTRVASADDPEAGREARR